MHIEGQNQFSNNLLRFIVLSDSLLNTYDKVLLRLLRSTQSATSGSKIDLL